MLAVQGSRQFRAQGRIGFRIAGKDRLTTCWSDLGSHSSTDPDI